MKGRAITAIPQRDIDKERAIQDCIKYGTPDPSVDHSNHYRKIEILMGKEKDDVAIQEKD